MGEKLVFKFVCVFSQNDGIPLSNFVFASQNLCIFQRNFAFTHKIWGNAIVLWENANVFQKIAKFFLGKSVKKTQMVCERIQSSWGNAILCERMQNHSSSPKKLCILSLKKKLKKHLRSLAKELHTLKNLAFTCKTFAFFHKNNCVPPRNLSFACKSFFVPLINVEFTYKIS